VLDLRSRLVGVAGLDERGRHGHPEHWQCREAGRQGFERLDRLAEAALHKPHGRND
jgi:hypothetical protein